MTPLVIAGGDAHPQLAAEVARLADARLIADCVSAFADGEARVFIEEDLAGADAYVVQPTPAPSGENLMKLVLIADAVRAAGAATVTAVVPYFGFARQDVRHRAGEPLSMGLAARVLNGAGVDRAVILELHSEAAQSAFTMPLVHLRADEPVLRAINEWRICDLVIVSPDAGALKRAQRYATALAAPLAVVAKTRPGADITVATQCLGEVRGGHCLIIDDMASTGRTAAGAAQALFQAGARAVDAVFIHAVMAEGALQRLRAAGIDRLAATDSLPDTDRCAGLPRIPVARLLARAILQLAGRTGSGSPLAD